MDVYPYKSNSMCSPATITHYALLTTHYALIPVAD